MSKRQLIEEIRKYNTTVVPRFLLQFGTADLKQYLEHLEGAAQHQMRIHSWVKRVPKLRLVS